MQTLTDIIVIIIKNAKIKVTLSHQGRCRGTLQNLRNTCVERCNVRLSAVCGTQQWLPISQRMTVGTDVLLSLSETAVVSCRLVRRTVVQWFKRNRLTIFYKLQCTYRGGLGLGLGSGLGSATS